MSQPEQQNPEDPEVSASELSGSKAEEEVEKAPQEGAQVEAGDALTEQADQTPAEESPRAADTEGEPPRDDSDEQTDDRS